MPSMRRRALRRLRRVAFVLGAAATAVASAQCGLLGAPGEYGGGAASSGGPDGAVDSASSADGTPPGDGSVVLPDGNVVPKSIGTITVLAGERDPSSPADDPAWSGDAWSAILDADGRVASWRVDPSAPIVGSFDTGGLVAGRLVAINFGFGLNGTRGTAIQSSAWSPGIVGDWRAFRVSPPGGLDDHTRLVFGPHVLFVGGTRTVTVDGGSNTFFTKEVHVADIDIVTTELAASANIGIELGLARSKSGVALVDGFIYVVGGRVASGTGITASVERTKADTTIGTITPFADQPALKNGAVEHRIFQPSIAGSGGYLFVAGGRTNGANEPTDVVLSSKIDPTTGDLSDWKSVTKLPRALRDFAFLSFKGRLYVIGGVGTPSRSKEVLSAKVNADGTLGAWDASNAAMPGPRSDFYALAY